MSVILEFGINPEMILRSIMNNIGVGTKTGDSYFTNEGVDNVLVTYEGLLEGAAKLYAGDHAMTDPQIGRASCRERV